jgi:hypothetical protein
MNPGWKSLFPWYVLGSQSATPAFTPADISGLALWLDATDATTITLDGSNNVSAWADKSGNSNNAPQSSTTLRPSGIGSLNGKTAIDFDGIDDYLEIANSTSINLGPNLSIFVVHKCDTMASRQTLFNFANTSAAHSAPGFEVGALNVASSYGVTIPGIYVLTQVNSASTSAAVAGFMQASSANTVIRKNGSQIAGPATQAGISASGLAKLIGVRAAGSQPYNGTIGEIVVYNKVLTGTDLTNLESYLISKWGIT